MRALIPLLFACAALSGCTSIFLYPDRYDHPMPRPLATATEDVAIRARDGSQLHALYMPAQAERKATVLFLHGNAENLSTHAYAVDWLPAQGYAVLALDYRGYGSSEGEADIDAVHEDAEDALAWLVARGEPNTGPLIVYGQSIGAAIAIRFVAESPLREHVTALIADSPFSAYRRIAREKLGAVWLTWPLQWPLSLLISDRYSAVDVVDRISPIPLLLIHGERDVIVDPSHSQRLYAAAREPKALWMIPQAGHINAIYREPVRKRLLEYLTEVVPAGSAARP